MYVYALFLVGTGIMTLVAWGSGIDLTENASLRTSTFMSAMFDSGYVIPWLGAFKVVAGILMAIPRTTPLGVLVAFPYAVNILLYVTFVSFEDYLVMGIVDFAISAYLVYAYSQYYRPMIVSRKL
jgi:hypothetical protein